jgi:hypothetical protein
MRVQLAALGIAVALYCSPAFAQHGHSGSAVGHMNGGNGHVMNTSTGDSAGSHRMTMDQQLSTNKNLSKTIKTLTGMDPQLACDGFKNLGRCVAAAHVSNNLHIPFDCLRSDMLGKAPTISGCPTGTGTGKMNLGKAIHTLRPDADRQSETKKAQREADQDLKSNS